jgi:predicted membrane-bound spermidine synthase
MLFLSGGSALIFQTLWLRLSGLTFGNSVWSAALILSSFMAGLAFGSGIAARAAIRRIQPLRLYAVLEVIIAVCGCGIVFVLPASGGLLRPLFQILWEHQAALNILRFCLSFLILLVPTTAMGLSLPIVLEDAGLRRGTFSRAIGLLYGANTIGAVVGAVSGEAFLVAAVGVLGASVVAGSLNITAAAIALLLAYRSSPAVEPAQSEGTGRRLLAVLRQTPWRLSCVSFGCGAVLLALEIVWFRFLRLYVASSATAFACMLAVVLAGIGTGSVAAGLFPRRKPSSNAAWLPVLLATAAIATMFSYWFFPSPALHPGENFYYIESWREVTLLSLALMFPVACLSGAIFPLVVTTVQEHVGSRMNSAGVTTLLNTIGAAVGPLAASFLLVPKLGFQSTLILCGISYAILAIVVQPVGAILRLWSGRALLVAVLLFAIALVFFPYSRHAAHLANARRSYEAGGLKTVKIVEGTSDTFQLLRRTLLGETYYYRLLTNAYSMSATNPPNQRYMRLSAYLPRLLVPEGKDALLICYGLGATADALLRGNQIQHLDIVDISHEVFDLSPLHSDAFNPDPLQNPRARSFVQDGRFFLQASRTKYDVITGEPPPPKVAGTVSLYSQEFFSLLAASLKEDGVATFWLPIYQLKVGETKAILRAFRNAFPTASVWASSDYEWIMLGTNGRGRTITADQFRRLWDDRPTGTDLQRIGVEVPEQASALFLMDADEIDRITKDTPPLTDLYPKRLSDAAPVAQETHDFAWPYMEAAQALPRFRASHFIQRVWPTSLTRGLDPFFVARETRYLSSVTPSNHFAELDLYLRHSKLRAPVLEILGSDAFRVEIARRYAAGSAEPPVDALPDLVTDALAERNLEKAVRLIEAQVLHKTADADDLLLLTYIYCVVGQPEKATAFAAEHRSEFPSNSDAKWLWGMLQAEFGFQPPS